MRALQACATPRNASPLTRNEQVNGSSPLVGSLVITVDKRNACGIKNSCPTAQAARVHSSPVPEVVVWGGIDVVRIVHSGAAGSYFVRASLVPSLLMGFVVRTSEKEGRMQMRNLGSQGLMVSELGWGAWG